MPPYRPKYQLAVKVRLGPKSWIDDGALRTLAVSMASTGMSRRGVASQVGISPPTLKEALSRGEARPDIEPWGSFSRDYLRAERGLEAAASSVIALTIQKLFELAKAGDWESLNEMGPQMKELLNVLAARFPEDWGVSAHRLPEKDVDGAAWLERDGMTHEQLVAMLSDPPEPVSAALVAAGDKVYALLLASGWAPKERQGV